jgi:glycosyltransferase involved in cell wall biosynthesis
LRKATVTVTNDLVTDQRVKKICGTLMESGYLPKLIGRKLNASPEMDERPYPCRRINLLFNNGPLFYAAYNLRVFFILLFSKTDLLYANDLDTLLANFLAAKIKGKPLIYDSHEVFTEVPELMENTFARRVWLTIERFIFPKLKHVITVNESIAAFYQSKYGVPVHVMRNVPLKSAYSENETLNVELPNSKYRLILQGSGINVQRGAEEAVQAMKYLDDVALVIAGSGDVIPLLKQMVEREQLSHKVCFLPRMDYTKLMQVTAQCDLGLSMDKDTNLNYRFSLPISCLTILKRESPFLSLICLR